MNDLFLHGLGSCRPGDTAVGEDAQRLSQLPIKDYIPPRQSRRFGRVAKLMYVAACRALEDAGATLDDSFALVSATAMGEVDASLTILEQIERTRGVTISPAQVPNSVHNSPAGYLTIGQEARIPALTLSQGTLSAEATLATAADLLDSSRATRILAVVADEYQPTWIQSLRERGATEAADALAAGFLSEGAVALVLGSEPGGRHLGRLNCSLDHTLDLNAALRLALAGSGIPEDVPHAVFLRSSAGCAQLEPLMQDLPGNCARSLRVEDGVRAGSLAGALTVLERHISNGDGSPMLSLSLELDELGMISWRGER